VLIKADRSDTTKLRSRKHAMVVTAARDTITAVGGPMSSNYASRRRDSMRDYQVVKSITLCICGWKQEPVGSGNP